MSRAQGLPKGSLPGTASAEPPPMQRHPELDINHYARQPGKSPSSLSKSRTVDVLKTEQQSPGRSPSSTSLRESKSRTDFKEDQKPSMMPSFLSEANPLSAVTSVVNKFNPFDLISESDAAQEEANRKQKAVQKDQGKPEEQKGHAKHPTQQQSPKPTVQQKEPVKSAPQQPGPSKLPPQQQQPGAAKQAPKPGPSQPTGPPSEQAKQPSQQRGPQRTQPQQSESTKQVPQQQSPSKPSTLQPGQTKTLPQLPDAARAPSHTPAPGKPSAQQPGPTKQPSQQPGQQAGPAKPSPQQAGPAKQPSQQLGPGKPSPQPAGPAKQPSQQLGPGKPSPQPAGPAKQPSQQPGPGKPSPQPAGLAKLPSKQPGPTKLSGQQPGPGKASQQQQVTAATPAESAPKKTFCPLCTSTELLLHTPEQANYNTCTQCQTVVCSLCGFNPNPHITEVKEWLCLNCQMQRALGGDLASVHGPVPQPLPSKQKATFPTLTTKAPSQPQQPAQKKDISQTPASSQSLEPKKPPPLTKQPSMPGSPPVKSKQPPTVPVTPHISQLIEPTPKFGQVKPTLVEDKQKKPTTDSVPASSASGLKQDSQGPKAPSTQQKAMESQKSEHAKLLLDTHLAGDKAVLPDSKTLPQVSRQKSDPKFVSQPGPDTVEPTQMKEDPKKTQIKVTPKPDAKQVPKGQQAAVGPKPTPVQPTPQPQQPQRAQEQPRRFSLNLGGITDTPKPQPTTPQETVTGKLFGFGASIFSQASNLISTSGQQGAQSSGPLLGPATKQPPPPSQVPSKEASQAQPSLKAAPVKKEAKPPVAEKSQPPKTDNIVTVKGSVLEKKPIAAKDSKPQIAESKKSAGPPGLEKITLPKSTCTLCKTGLNIGSKDPPNFNTCTECKNIVCNLCGFNPMPHIVEIPVLWSPPNARPLQHMTVPAPEFLACPWLDLDLYPDTTWTLILGTKPGLESNYELLGYSQPHVGTCSDPWPGLPLWGS
ncbi:unnamed protein product [Caretta caretta]